MLFYNFVYDELEKYSRYLSGLWCDSFVIRDKSNASVNAFLRMELGSLSMDTVHVRRCLEDHIAEGDWLNNFKNEVLPFIISNGLPCWHNDPRWKTLFN